MRRRQAFRCVEMFVWVRVTIRGSRMQSLRLLLDVFRIPGEPRLVVCFFVGSTVDRQLGGSSLVI
jgi:hypothetical protein